MTVADFERAAIAAMQDIAGCTSPMVSVAAKTVTAACRIDGKAVEVTVGFTDEDNRRLAFAHVLASIRSTAANQMVRARGLGSN